MVVWHPNLDGVAAYPIEATLEQMAESVDSEISVLHSSSESSAPSATTSISSYPSGLSVRIVSSDISWPVSFGIVITFNYPSSSRSIQIFQSVGSGTIHRQFIRSWRVVGPNWSSWAETTSDNNPQPVEVFNETSQVGIGTSYALGSPTVGIAFTAPPSGKVWIAVSGRVRVTTNGHNTYLSFQLRSGSTIGLGTVHTPAHAERAVLAGQAVVSGGFNDNEATYRVLFSGLTPGNSYNASTQHLCTLDSAGTVFSRRLSVEPVL